MFDFQEKRKIRGLIYSKVTIGAVFVLTVLLGFSVYERYSVEREMQQKRVVQEEALQELEERAQFLEEKVEHLENARGIEEELRNRFDVAKEGEQVVVIVSESEGESVDLDELSSPPGEPKEKRSFWDFLKFW